MNLDVRQLVGVAQLQSFAALSSVAESVEVNGSSLWSDKRAAPPPPLPPPQPQKIAVSASVQCAFSDSVRNGGHGLAFRRMVGETTSSGYNTRMSSLPASLTWAHPLVAEWFVRRFGTPTEPQEQGWPHILAGRTTLISAPTGSGKTLAAFLACIDRLVRKALAGDLADRTEVLYVSPLKALGNDIQKNLEVPLGEILAMAGERGLLMPEIRAAVRTGDTLMPERRAMLKRPPHILVTTPESLYILLTADKSRAILRDVETVIVDEIHAVADDKRGAHLTLSLERLEALTHKPPVRIGLSATQKPIEEVAHFLTGSSNSGNQADTVIVNIGHKRKLDMAVEVPSMPLGPVASNEM